MHVLDAQATRRALPFEALIPALRRMFIEGCEVPRRHVHQVGSFTSLLMPAWNAQHYGLKTINIAPGNAARDLPGLHAVYQLFDATTGVPLALLDGDEITARRTAAASALAASFITPARPRRLLVVGAGRVARLLPPAYAAVRPLQQVTVWARSATQAEALAAEWRAQGFAAQAVNDLEAAVRAADIVSCATLATSPLVQGAWLAEGSHLDLIGSFTPQMREADDACLAGARLYVDTEEALEKSGDLLGPLSRGVFTAADVRGTLAALCRGQVAASGSQGDGLPGAGRGRTVFKSVGTALEDLAAAVLAFQAASA
ncbi:ornithine cyclodeaminase family protein [Aquincola sp. J276]|nr:ornithine cyclodeaminase family protein [Aquincola sp. J276]